jgi:hypothetical protein
MPGLIDCIDYCRIGIAIESWRSTMRSSWWIRMGHSQRLTQADIVRVFRLLGEVRELSADPLAWRRRMLEGLCEMTGAQLGIGGEAPFPYGSHQQYGGVVDIG